MAERPDDRPTRRQVPTYDRVGHGYAARRLPDPRIARRIVAETLPFADRTFDAVMTVLSMHHWRDFERGAQEMRRVAGTAVVLTFDPSRMADFWLSRDYIPASAASDADAPRVGEIAEALAATSVAIIPIPHDCLDGFMGAYWRRPAAYLDPGVRAAISSLARLEPRQIEPGLARLRDDLESGAWHERHGDLLVHDEIDLGYRLVVARS